MNVLDNPLTLWGKARAGAAGRTAFHPLIFHGLDVAACFERLVLLRPSTSGLINRAFDADQDQWLAGLTALIALHDIGKTLAKFQMKVPELCPPELRSDGLAGLIYNHAEGGFYLLRQEIKDGLAPILRRLDKAASLALLRAVAHHHGRPLPEDGLGDATPADVANARHVIGHTLSVFGTDRLLLPEITELSAERLSWPLAGLITLADWLGSSDHFPFVSPEALSAAEYWEACARPCAAQAVTAAGLVPPRSRTVSGGAALFGNTFNARPAQCAAETLALGSGPQLFILEDMTGAGKTEAALILAHRLMAAGRASGLFVALPTTATADAMYQRMAEAYARLFADGSLPSLALAHGRRHLNDGFRTSLFSAEGLPEASMEDGENRTACNAFFADDRRKTFLADVGVGTIDQALMAVLPTKFATLRQYGLADKVLVVDEAHAYDAYMSKEVERLLAFHAAAGGSAILLSATLPQKTRTAFAHAFRGGGKTAGVALAEQAYPLLTRIPAKGGLDALEVPIEPTSRQPVGIRRLATPDEALDLIVEAARSGASVAYIRNAVDDARETAEALQARGLSPTLFHARFAMGDRLAIEKTVLRTFGKAADAGMRAGQVLVATQVVEQSLDLDFDVMISDLAPIDLLIQRAGRLWRHQRASRPVQAPVLHVVAPEPSDDAGQHWLLPTFKRMSSVYKAHGLLWLTASELFKAGAIGGPEEMRRLVEAVYAPDLSGADAHLIPEGLRPAEITVAGERNAARSFAAQNLLTLKDGYAVGNRPWQSDILTPTRLGEEQRVFRLARWQDGQLTPWAAQQTDAGSDPVRLWALSEVSLRLSQANGRPDLPSPLRQAVAAIETRWQSLAGDGTLILPLLATDTGWAGNLTRERNRQNETIAVRYSPETGLAFG